MTAKRRTFAAWPGPCCPGESMTGITEDCYWTTRRRQQMTMTSKMPPSRSSSTSPGVSPCCATGRDEQQQAKDPQLPASSLWSRILACPAAANSAVQQLRQALAAPRQPRPPRAELGTSQGPSRYTASVCPAILSQLNSAAHLARPRSPMYCRRRRRRRRRILVSAGASARDARWACRQGGKVEDGRRGFASERGQRSSPREILRVELGSRRSQCRASARTVTWVQLERSRRMAALMLPGSGSVRYPSCPGCRVKERILGKYPRESTSQ